MLLLSHIVEVREDARCKRRLKGKILVSDFLLVGEQRALGVMNFFLKKKKCGIKEINAYLWKEIKFNIQDASSFCPGLGL